MSEIKPDDVIWTMKWEPRDKYPDKPATEECFEEAKALAVLLAEEVVFTNEYWWEKDWPEKARKATAIAVNCSDVFAWGCADAVGINYEDIEPVYRAWLADKQWGPTKWCCHRRNQKPQGPVEKAMRAAGVWDEGMERIGDNTMDAELHEALGLPAPKYDKGEYVQPKPKRRWWQRFASDAASEPPTAESKLPVRPDEP